MKTLQEFTEEEKERAVRLAEELCNKIEEYFPKKCSDEEMEEIESLKRELEKIGFVVGWNGSLDIKTLKFRVSVTLWVPKQIH